MQAQLRAEKYVLGALITLYLFVLAVALTEGGLIGLPQMHLSPGVFSNVPGPAPVDARAGAAWTTGLLIVALSPVLVGLLASCSTVLLSPLQRVIMARVRASKESARKP